MMMSDSFFKQYKQLYKLSCMLPQTDNLQKALRVKRVELIRFLTPSEIDNAMMNAAQELWEETANV
jgi:hypothetical protein